MHVSVHMSSLWGNFSTEETAISSLFWACNTLAMLIVFGRMRDIAFYENSLLPSDQVHSRKQRVGANKFFNFLLIKKSSHAKCTWDELFSELCFPIYIILYPSLFSIFFCLWSLLDLTVVYFHPFLFSLLGKSYCSFLLSWVISLYQETVCSPLNPKRISHLTSEVFLVYEKARSHLCFPKTDHAVFSNQFLLGLSSKVTVNKFKASTISDSSLNLQHHQQYPQSKQLMKVCLLNWNTKRILFDNFLVRNI